MKIIEWQEMRRAKIKNTEETFIMTPMGPFNSSDFGKDFSFWIGNTNFPLDVEFFDKVDTTLGVESFAVLTPYKFVITIAKLFDPDQVKQQIYDLIREESPEVLRIKQDLSKYNNWAIFVLPNGEINYTFDEDDNFAEMVKTYEKLKSEVGGRIITPASSQIY